MNLPHEGTGGPARWGAGQVGLRSLWVRGAWRRVATRHALTLVDAEPGDALVPDEGARVFAIRQCTREIKPQRGRARSFWLLSCRAGGDESVRADAEAIACAVECLRELGVTPQQVKVRISHRGAVRSLLARRGVAAEEIHRWFPLLHRAGKMSNDDFMSEAVQLEMEARTALDVLRVLTMSTPFEEPTTQMFLSEQAGGRGPEYFKALFADLRALGVAEWCVLNLGIVRRGADYTGMVFEVHDAGRGGSVAGGGRRGADEEPTYVGFDMGDTALGQVLADAGLWPNGDVLAVRLGARADVFVAAVDDADALAAVLPAVAGLRRAGLHARYSIEPVRDAAAAEGGARGAGPGGGARYAVLLEAGVAEPVALVKNLEAGDAKAHTLPLNQLAAFFTR